MPEKENTLWQVVLEQKKGKLVIRKADKPITSVLTELEKNPHIPATVVQIPVKASLAVALASEHGQLPPGITPFVSAIDKITQTSKNKLTVFWVCLGYLVAKDESGSTDAQTEDTVENGDTENGDDNDHEGNGDTITPRQKRYLFRLLAQKEIKGDKAVDYLKQELDVDFVSKASKFRASQLIDQLVNGGG